MKTEETLGVAIPVIYFLLVALDARYKARQFELISRWRWTGALFLLMVLIVGSAVPLLLPQQWFKEHAVMDLSGIGLMGIPIALLVTTFFAYWFHRAEHRFNWLWRATHQLHHSALRVDISGAFYAHPFEIIAKVSISTVISLYLLGLSPIAASGVGLIGAMLSMFQHCNINTPHWLGYIIPRPESHVLHHAQNLQIRNYGDLPIWDMLFGTFTNPRKKWAGKVGFGTSGKVRVVDMLLMRDVSK